MNNPNSLRAWAIILASGKISKLRKSVAKMVFESPNKTGGELARINNVEINTVTRRFSELERMNIIVKTGERKCSVTGHIASTFIINERLSEEGIKTLDNNKQVSKSDLKIITESIEKLGCRPLLFNYENGYSLRMTINFDEKGKYMKNNQTVIQPTLGYLEV